MDLRQMRYFLKVAETLNFSAASKELCITQSTLSQQINHLEYELEQKLFERNSHQVQLTEAGEELIPYVSRCIEAATECYERAKDFGTTLSGHLNIGVTHSFSGIMTEVLIDFLKQYPHVKINVYYETMDKLIENLEQHRLDLVLAFKPAVETPRIHSEQIFVNSLAVVVDEEHPLAKKKSVTLDDLAPYPLAMPATGLQARHLFDQLSEHLAPELNVKLEINNVQMLQQLVRDSNYATVLSASTVINTSGLRAVKLDIEGNEMAGCIHTLANSYTKKSAREYIRLIKESTAIVKVSNLKDLFGA